MYAIRSYYGQESKYSDAEIILNKVQDEYPQAEVVALENGIRITSYNVCYTKLLRSLNTSKFKPI